MAKIDCNMKSKGSDAVENCGGYNCNFITPAPKVLLCKLCHFPSRDPIQSNCCGGSFCEVCFTKYLESKYVNCPSCQEHDFKVFSDKRALHEILNLLLYCPNKKGGCEWSGELRALEKHLEECPQAVVECPYSIVGCQSFVKRAEKLNHLKEMAEQHLEYNLDTSIRNQRELQSTKQQLIATEEELKCTQHQLEETNKNLELNKQTMETRLQVKDQEIADLRKDVRQLKEILTSREKKITEDKEIYQEITTRLDNKIEKLVTVQYYLLHKTQSTWPILLNTLASASGPVLPVIVRMGDFMAMKDSAVVNNWWYSNGFYSCNGGYKMCLGVVACGYYANPEKVSKSDYDRGFLTASLFLMRGEYDDQLVWPKPISTVTFQLLNQISDADHLDPFVCRFDGHTSGSQRVTYAPISNWAFHTAYQLISHDQLGYDGKKQYLKDDCLMFKVYL